MKLNLIKRSIRKSSTSAKRDSRAINRSRRMLFAEPLETRVLLTSYIVDTLDDTVAEDGLISLREAVMASNSNTAVGDAAAGTPGSEGVDGIRFAPSLAGQTIVLTGGELDISDSLNILNHTNSPVVIDGNASNRIFNITDGAENVALINMYMQNGAADEGGGIYMDAGTRVVLRSSTIINSTAERGGGIFNNGGILVLTQGTSIVANEATGDAVTDGGGGIYQNAGLLRTYDTGLAVGISQNSATGTSGNGGGIFINAGAANLADVTIAENSANRAGGGIEIVDGSMQVSSSRLVNNDVNGNAGTANPGNGGAVHVSGAATTRFINSNILGNSAAREGGGLWNSATGTMVVSDGTIISQNVALGDAADDGGGGIFNNGGRLTVRANSAPVVISENFASGAAGSGGGIFNATNGTVLVIGARIQSNYAERAGGGIEDVGNVAGVTSMRLVDVELLGNTAAGTGDAPGNGGGLHVTGAGDVLIQNSLISENFAAAEGGGLWNGSGMMTIQSSEILTNEAGGDDSTQGGGGVYNLSGVVQIQNSTVASNVASGTLGSGGGIFNDAGGSIVVGNSLLAMNTANRAGGAIEDNSGSVNALTIAGSTLSQNSAGGPGSTPSPGSGGAIHVTGSGNVMIDRSNIVDNFAASEGGGLWNGSGTMTVNQSDVSGNSAAGNTATEGGGGIFNLSGILRVTRSTIDNNTANGTSGSGGGIFNDQGGSVTVFDTTISNNFASRAGGGIEDNSNSSNALVISQVEFLSNITGSVDGAAGNPGNGGGIHVTGSGRTRIGDSIFRDNVAAAEGGALWNGSGVMTVARSEFTNNVTFGTGIDQGGGAIFNNGGSLLVSEGSVFMDNAADEGRGSEIFSDGGGVNITGSTFTNNDGAMIVLLDAAGNVSGNTFNGDAIDVRMVGGEDNDTITVTPNSVAFTTFGSPTRLSSFDNALRSLEFHSLGGDDIFDVTPQANTRISIRGGDNVGAVGDSLVVQTVGTTNPQFEEDGPDGGTFTFDDRADVVFTEIETLINEMDQQVI